MPAVVLLIGTNLGKREKNLIRAYNYISEIIGKVRSMSSIHESEPWGFESNNKFLNQIIICETLLSPFEILNKIHYIEKIMGRQRPFPNNNNVRTYTSRIIDIDILFYDNIVLNSEKLIIPHPRICEREFVLKLLKEIIPDFIHPVKNIKIREL